MSNILLKFYIKSNTFYLLKIKNHQLNRKPKKLQKLNGLLFEINFS